MKYLNSIWFEMKAVALVKSPLQYMNALEARRCFQVPAEKCLLVLMADRKSLPQLLSLVEKTPGWAGIIPLVNVR